MTNQSFLPVTLRTFIYLTPKTIKSAASLKLTPGSLVRPNPIHPFCSLYSRGLMPSDLTPDPLAWGEEPQSITGSLYTYIHLWWNYA